MDRTSEFKAKDIQENKGIACFAYFGFLFVMPWWAADDSPFAQFHANQGAVLAMNQLITCILVVVAHLLVPVAPAIFRILRTILCAVLILSIIFYTTYGVVNTLKGKAKELPFIGSIKVLR
ncbi:MAG: zinc ribbon domain-containing protein [Clostridia bacterium]|jgi:uncharacterized membrane protein|nr:zinc ribbon domain-containing protein [Clostridia bacterium]